MDDRYTPIKTLKEWITTMATQQDNTPEAESNYSDPWPNFTTSDLENVLDTTRGIQLAKQESMKPHSC